MFDILALIPGKKKKTGSGWYSFNAICCSHRGHREDKRSRGGIKYDGINNWVMHCFNCGYSCSFTLGMSITSKTRQFLLWCGVDSDQIQRYSLESLQKKDLLDFTVKRKTTKIKFDTIEPIKDSIPIDTSNIDHQKFVNYLTNRSIDPASYPFLITPYDSVYRRNRNRIIIPYFYKSKMVGYTSRYLDNNTPKYLNIGQQPGYVFNFDNQQKDWSVCIVTEGIFDALSIGGVAVMHDDISPEQSELISSLNRRVIVVPDFDKTGLTLIDRALDLGYGVSLPEWAPGIKDVNDAVIKYGRLPTLLSIIQSATNSKIKLELRKRQIAKGL